MTPPAGWSPASIRSGSPARPSSTRRADRWPASIRLETQIQQYMTLQVVASPDINPLGFINSSVYDQASRLIATVDPLGNRSSIGYDAASRSVSRTNPLGFTKYDRV